MWKQMSDFRWALTTKRELKKKKVGGFIFQTSRGNPLVLVPTARNCRRDEETLSQHFQFEMMKFLKINK